MTPIWHPSPNFGPRKEGAVADMVVIHYTAMADAEGALKVLCNPDNEVSAHYLIGADGAVYQMVDEAQRAWHAGAGRWGDVVDVNSRSIGILLDAFRRRWRPWGDGAVCEGDMRILSGAAIAQGLDPYGALA